MKQNKSFFLTCSATILLTAIPSIAKAAVEYTFYPASNPATITITGPADAGAFATTIYNSGTNGTFPLCGSNIANVKWDLTKITMTSLVPVSGTYQASSAHPVNTLYSVGVSGFAVIPQYGSYYFTGGDLTSAVAGGVMPTGVSVAWIGNTPDAKRRGIGIQTRASYAIWKDAFRITNAVMIPETRLYRYDCYDSNNTIQETYYISMKPTPISANVTTCTPDSKTASINMNNLPVSAFKDATNDTLIGTKSQAFSLKCDPNISLLFSLVDVSNPSNFTTTANLTSDSTAKGIGFAVTSQAGSRLKFGPDGSASGIPNQTSYFLGNSGTNGGIMSHSLNFSYVRKTDEELKSGVAKGIVGIVYSYR